MEVVDGGVGVGQVLGKEEKNLLEELSLSILLSERVIKLAQEAESSKEDCLNLAKQVDRLSQMLRSCVRLSTTTQPLYERPIRRISGDVVKNLDRALVLVRKCKHGGVLRHVFAITTTADFRKVCNLLESSIGDMRWLLSIFDSSDGGTHLSLPPIASNDPILAWVWSFICTVHIGQIKDKIEAANGLASLARDNDRNKQIIVVEGGIVPLLKLLKEVASAEAQIAAANALYNIGTDEEKVRMIVRLNGIRIIVGVISESTMRVQIPVVNLVAKMVEVDSIAQEEFVRENVTRPLLSLLAMDLVLDVGKPQTTKTSIHSIIQMKKDLADSFPGQGGSLNLSAHSSFSDGSSRGGNKKERETETPEIKHNIRVSCAEALWKLAKGKLSTSKKITETKGLLLCLAKVIEKEKEELQFNCLMTVMEITAVAEDDPGLRRAAFRTNSPAAKAVLDQLLRLIQEKVSPTLTIPSIKAIGCLAKTFPAKETQIIRPLVEELGNSNVDVAKEAAIALGKFVCPENYNCLEHSKSIVEFDGVPHTMKLVKSNDGAQLHGIVLLCCLALNVGNSKALEQARTLNALEGAGRIMLAQRPEIRDLYAKAIHHLTLYQPGAHPHRKFTT